MRLLVRSFLFCTLMAVSFCVPQWKADRPGSRVGLFTSAAAQPHDDKPLLVAAAEGHLAMIKDVAFTPDGRQLVSSSDDKTIRVWDLETGETVRTIRGEIAPGATGKIYAMALSSDGRWLATGGKFHPSDGEAASVIRLYDFLSGRLIALLAGHEDAVIGLAFSADSEHLISGSVDKAAMIWDVGSRKLKHRLDGHTDVVYAVGFTPDGKRVVTGSDDRDLRLWNAEDGHPVARMPGHGNKVYALAIAPDGTIASGDQDGEIRLWSGSTGAFLRALPKMQQEIGSLAFSPDSKSLLVGTAEDGPVACQVYNLEGGEPIPRCRDQNNIVLASAISSDGHWAATAGGPNYEIQIWDLRSGEPRLRLDGRPMYLGGAPLPVTTVGFAPDGSRIAWGGLATSAGPAAGQGLQMAVDLKSADGVLLKPQPLDPVIAGTFRRAITTQNGWSIVHRNLPSEEPGDDAILDIAQGGKVVASIDRSSEDGYGHSAYSFTSDGETVISGGGGGVLKAYDRGGKELGEFIGHEADIWTVATSADNRFLASAAADMTVRLWNLRTRQLLVTIFQSEDGNWIMWTPSGYYTASLGGEALIGWQINRGPGREADFFPTGQFRDQYYRPEIVALTVKLGNEADAIAKSTETTGRGQAQAIKERLPAVINIVGLIDGDGFSDDRLTVSYRLRSPSGLKVSKVRALIDSRPVEGEELKGFVPVSADDESHGRLVVRVPPQDISLSLLAETEGAASATATVRLKWRGQAQSSANNVRKPTLYALIIGVSEYLDQRIDDLQYADDDATDIAQKLKKQEGRLYREVKIQLLVDKKATRAAIIEGLQWLKRSVVEPGDTGLVFLSGHGATDKERNYYYLPHDSELDPDAGYFLPLRSTAVPNTEIRHTLASLRGNAVLFFDTCHAGFASGTNFNTASGLEFKGVQDLFATIAGLRSPEIGAVVLASSGGGELSQESDTWKHGAFTEALLKGLDGHADFFPPPDKIIGIGELTLYVSEEVKRLTDGRQNPVEERPKATRNFSFAYVQP